jgi:hypothetical protein
MEMLDEASPRARARITGVVYLVFFVTAIAGEAFNRRAGLGGIQLDSSTDSALTLNSIPAHVASLRWGFAFGLFSTSCYVVVTALFYQLFRPVSRSLSFIAVCFSLMGLVIQALGSLLRLSPLVLLGDGPASTAFDPRQRSALALISLDLSTQIGRIGLVFDGLFLLLIGYLIVRSTFLPRVLGVLIALAGAGWLTFLSPPLASQVLPYIEALGFIAEVLLMLWLLVVGVNVQRWTDRSA